MSSIEEFYQRMKLESELADMEHIVFLEDSIKYFSELYHKHIKNNNLNLADIYNNIITLHKEEIENVRKSLSNSCEVSTPSAAGNKKVFILQR